MSLFGLKFELCVILFLCMCSVKLCRAQEEESCYGGGSIAASVILTFLATILLIIAVVFAWKKYKLKQDHLIIQTDPEKGKGEYAFDNPGFKESSILAIPKAVENNIKLENKVKWNQWSPLTALTTKNEKRKTLDDSALEENEVKVVALRSHDFTGLGFNIEGNMKEGIFIKDILHRGPAFESGKLNPGDRINSVTISFEHMVYEDALTILSYASPYEVIIEVKSGRLLHHTSGQGGQPSHPVFRSSSCIDLYQLEKTSKTKLSGDDCTGSMSSNYSSLQKSRSNMTTLERKESKSPRMRGKKLNAKHLSPDQLKVQLEQKIGPDHQTNHKHSQKPQKIDSELQKSEYKHQKFGIKVLPLEVQQKSPKNESSQNDNNTNIEKYSIDGIDEVDENKKPQVKKREKKLDSTPETLETNFIRQGSLGSSGIKRDTNGIPQEIPSHMLNAAVVARRNRKNSIENRVDDDEDRGTKKIKGKAPVPPAPIKKNEDYDEIKSIQDDVRVKTDDGVPETNTDLNSEKQYNSDSDIETDNHSSVNTIELNASDITIHQTEDESRENRRTASTGDLSKIQRTRKSSTGTLERAQSLDITDTGMPSALKRKGGQIDDMGSDEDLFGNVMLNKNPRLSLILDGLNTFQRNRLKTSTEWGNLEDAILKLNQEDENMKLETTSKENSFLEGKSPEFKAVIDKIMQIKNDSNAIELPEELVQKYANENQLAGKMDSTKVKNQIWPSQGEFNNSSCNNNNHIVTSIRDISVNKVSKQIKDIENKPIYELNQEISSIKTHPEGHNVKMEKRQIKPSRVINETIDQSDNVLKDQTDVAETTEYTPMTKEMLEPIEAPPEKHKRQRQPKDVSTSTVSLNRPEITVSLNNTDETKTITNLNGKIPNLFAATQNFLYTEQLSCSQDYNKYSVLQDDTNIPDDIKVSRHSHNTVEVKTTADTQKSDDMKSRVLTENISNIEITNENGESTLHSLELSINEKSDLYTTALDNTTTNDLIETNVTVSTPDIIQNTTETITTLNHDEAIMGPASLTLEIPLEFVEVTETDFSKVSSDSSNDADKSISSSKNSTLTYVTEIQVPTPNQTLNISEIEIHQNSSKENGRNLDSDFEDYVKNFESRIENEDTNISDFETNMEEFINKEPKSIIINEKIDPEKELHKIHEIAEEQLKKLPEMKFSTSYESKIPEKRQSQIELLRSNFEKSPHKLNKSDSITKSRIPIATTAKTPPMSPERRDSRNLDNENDKAILELMSSSVHSTPVVSHMKYQSKSPSRNVTVTSIRTNSKIHSGLPTYTNSSRPPIPPKRVDSSEGDNMVQISTNGNSESSFKQWVFNPSNNNAVTNIVVREHKEK